MAQSLRVCSWEDVSLREAEQLLELCSDTESLQTRLTERLVARETERTERQTLIELDLFTYAVLFCKKSDFSAEQLSVFFTILKSVHSMCISTPYDNLQETFVYFRDLLLRHSVQRPPFSISLYTLAHVKTITDYVLSTYFKHFKMYKYAFTKRLQLNLTLQYSDEPGSEEGEGEETGERGERGERGGEEIEEGEEGDVQALPVEEDEDGGSGGETEREVLDPEQQRLKDVITSALTSHLKKLKVSLHGV